MYELCFGYSVVNFGMMWTDLSEKKKYIYPEPSLYVLIFMLFILFFCLFNNICWGYIYRAAYILFVRVFVPRNSSFSRPSRLSRYHFTNNIPFRLLQLARSPDETLFAAPESNTHVYYHRFYCWTQ